MADRTVSTAAPWPAWAHIGALVVGCLALATLLRMPLSLNPNAVPLDPNTPLHAIAVRQIAGLGSPTILSMINPPEGVPVRIVAWPLVLIAAPLTGLLGALPAVNIATTILLALQGLAVAWAARVLQIGRGGQWVGAVAAISAPVVLHAQSLGRPENLAFPAFALIVVASTLQRSRNRVLLATAGLLMAAFSSPYQAIPAGLLLIVGFGFSGWQPRRDVRPWLELAVVTLFAALPTVAYFIDAAAGNAGESAFTSSPPESAAVALTGFGELTWPRAMAHGRPVYGHDLQTRLADLWIQSIRFGPRWGVRSASQMSWLGHVLLALGLLGCWKHRHRKFVPPLVVAGLLCVLCALGPDLRMWSERPWGIPLPWQLTTLLPGLDALVATSRFLSGTVFALCLAAAAGLDARPRWMMAAASVALLVDGAWRTPQVWPVPAAQTRFEAVLEQLPPGPIALWPPLDTIPAQNLELAALLADRHIHMMSMERETPPEWLRRIGALGVQSFVNLDAHEQDGLLTTSGNRVPMEIRDESGRPMLMQTDTCIDDMCWRAFRWDRGYHPVATP